MQDVIEFGAILKFVRKSRRITQEALADSCGLDRTYIGLLERGKRSPTMETLCKLSVGLDILPSVLLGYWEDTLAMKWREEIHSLIRDSIPQTEEETRSLDSPAVHMAAGLAQLPGETSETAQATSEEFSFYKDALSEDVPNFPANNKELLSLNDLTHTGRHNRLGQTQAEESILLIDKVILLGLIKAKVRKNSYDKSTFFEGIQSTLSLALANEALGFDVAQNQSITQSIIDIVEKAYDYDDGSTLETGMDSE